MSLLEEVNALPTNNAAPNKCKTCHYLDGMDSDDRDAINAALVAGARPAAITEVLNRNGYDVGGDSVARHHKKGHSAV